MRTAGLRELKAKLAEYIRDVRRGETVLVTDRGQVVAEINPPAASDVAANDGTPEGKHDKIRAQDARQDTRQNKTGNTDAQAQNADVTIKNVKPAATSGDSAAALRKAGDGKSVQQEDHDAK